MWRESLHLKMKGERGLEGEMRGESSSRCAVSLVTETGVWSCV